MLGCLRRAGYPTLPSPPSPLRRPCWLCRWCSRCRVYRASTSNPHTHHLLLLHTRRRRHALPALWPFTHLCFTTQFFWSPAAWPARKSRRPSDCSSSRGLLANVSLVISCELDRALGLAPFHAQHHSGKWASTPNTCPAYPLFLLSLSPLHKPHPPCALNPVTQTTPPLSTSAILRAALDLPSSAFLFPSSPAP